MPYTIVSDICEGAADCIPVCPVDCIHWPDGEPKNEKGFKYPYIDHDTCIDCGACLAACPVEGAVLDDAQPELQKV
jgi:NAD-dependent dihydropyrimidine dehydrogenase PreA subunit